ncbi:hypothetical protein PGB90_008592 [Kerria lacca]
MSTSCTNIYGTSPVSSCIKTKDIKNWTPSSVSTEIPIIINTEEDTKNVLQNKINSLKIKFHQDRKLLVKHLPRNVVKQEIAQLLNDFSIQYIHLTSNDDKSSTATVTLNNPEVLDEWNSDRTFLLRGQSVSVLPTPTEMLLCIAKLPFHFTESDFNDLIKVYGEVKMYFLMISEKTGKSKGYGFVHYTNKEHALIARNALNDKTIETFQLVCDWVDSSHLNFRSLHSTCLYVDKLPRQFRDMGEFRAIFEKIVKPPYCQIALKNGCPLDWGLVEYLSPDDAELAQTSCNNYYLRNQPIRIVYFIPGVRAITLMLSLLDMPSRGKSTGLLPDPTGQSIRMSIENLSKQNPIFAENLKSIILHQIKESNNTKDNNKDDVNQNSSGKVSDIKIIDNAKQNTKDMEKMIPPTPPMTPTILNTLPIMNPVGVSPLPLLPNTAVPPPVIDKIPYSQPLSLTMKDKYPVLWNDVIGQTVPNGTFSPIIPTITSDSTTPPFAVRPTPIPANFVQEVINLPLNVQQNILNILNNTTPVSLSVPQVHNVPPPVSFSSLTVDPTWILQKTSETLVSPITPSLITVPIGTKSVIPNSWPSIPSFIPPGNIPVFTTAEWHNLRGPSTVISSQPSTPVMHHYAGQKRKLLPSPEKSPEGNYIGQHSQGLGGHYADSYFKKKKMF